MGATETAVDEARLEQVIGQAVTDMGAAMNGALIAIGGQLGIWKAMAGAGPMTTAEIAERSGVAERYVREWASAQAASGYLEYDADAETFTLTPEVAMAYADEDSPVFLLGGYSLIGSVYKDRDKLAERFKDGKGFGWHEHDPDLFVGTEQFFRPGLPDPPGRRSGSRRWRGSRRSWTPAARWPTSAAATGSRRPDGEGVPERTISGFDYHDASIARAEGIAEAEGVGGEHRVRGREREGLSGRGIRPRLLLRLPARHGRPGRRDEARRETIADDGAVMLVEPFANESLAENLNPVGRIYYAASTVVCTPSSLDQEVGLALGAQAGEERLREVAEEAGFSRFAARRRRPSTSCSEARP